MVEPDLIVEWLNKADEDFNFATSIIQESTYYAQICYHFHQAAEKYLKAYIIANTLPFKKIHDLLTLLKTSLDANPDLQVIREDCRFLNRYYIDTRYPVHWPTSYTNEEAYEAKEACERIREVIKKSLMPFTS